MYLAVVWMGRGTLVTSITYSENETAGFFKKLMFSFLLNAQSCVDGFSQVG